MRISCRNITMLVNVEEINYGDNCAIAFLIES